jgi:hypothetical protein
MSATDHAQVHGSPGEGARMAGLGRAIGPLLAAMFFTGYVVGAALGASMGGWTIGVVLALAGLLLLLGVFTCTRRVAAFFKGAAGEEIVARELARLPAGYHVFHSLDAGGGVLMWRGGDIDHVVVGPTGVFAIETKNWRGQVTLADGQILLDGAPPRRSPLEQARQAVSKLQVRLGRGGIYDANVAPVVCFAGDRFDADCQTVGDAVVCNAARLLDVLTDAKRSGTARMDVDGIVRALQASSVS